MHRGIMINQMVGRLLHVHVGVWALHGAPLHASATSQGPAAARQMVPLATTASLGQVTEEPAQKASEQQGKAQSKQNSPHVHGSMKQRAALSNARSNRHTGRTVANPSNVAGTTRSAAHSARGQLAVSGAGLGNACTGGTGGHSEQGNCVSTIPPVCSRSRSTGKQLWTHHRMSQQRRSRQQTGGKWCHWPQRCQ